LCPTVLLLPGALVLPPRRPQRFSYAIRVKENAPDLPSLYKRLCRRGSCGAVRNGDPHVIGRCVRELCHQYSIADRMPRPIIPGDKQTLDKRIVEELANQVYVLTSSEYERQPSTGKTIYQLIVCLLLFVLDAGCKQVSPTGQTLTTPAATETLAAPTKTEKA
jgi:hypothetical protein